MNTLSVLLLSIFIGAFGQVFLKLGSGGLIIEGQNLVSLLKQMGTNPQILGGLFLFGVSSFLWILGVSKVPLSYAYPMVSLGYGIVLFISWLWLGESISWIRVLGVGIICIGVILVAKS